MFRAIPFMLLSLSGATPVNIDPFTSEWSYHIISIGTAIVFLTLAPTFLMVCTSFTRIIIIFSLLRVALGTNQSPPNLVLISIALFISLFIMRDAIQDINDNAISPFQNGDIEFSDAITLAQKPIRSFMLKHTSQDNINLFMSISSPSTKEFKNADIPISTLIPAFIITELHKAFTVGFMIFLPFIIIDIVVASVLMAMGVMMLPPVMISLPIKLVFFVAVDGWHMIVGSLVKSYN